MSESKELTVPQACDLLATAIERDLSNLSKAGSEAFARRDMSAAEDALSATRALTTFREQVSALLTQWGDKLKG